MNKAENKKIIIFGGTSTIAVATAREFATRDNKLFLVARDGEALNEVAEDLKARGAEVDVCVSEFIDLDNLDHIFQKATNFMDGLDGILVAHGSLTDQTRAEHDLSYLASELHTNFISTVAIITKAAGILEQQKSGFIVAISSVAGDRGRKGIYIYGSAKAAITTFMSGIRGRLLTANVQVLTVKPGFIRSKMTVNYKQGALFADPEVVAKDIIKGIERGSEVIYSPWFWRIIMCIIKLIPEKIFKRMSI